MKKHNALPRRLISLLRSMGWLAEERGCKAFAVGGFVRDMLMGVKNLDVDIVIEGDGIPFAKDIARTNKGTFVAYRKFGTATVTMPWPHVRGGRLKVDIATVRRERYKSPAALPEVEFASLKDDLYRRDFTINAMAMALEKKGFGRIIDFFGGRSDLRKGVISVLHNRSFVDDPTRIFRAVRFEQRFGFKIDARTEKLIKNAIREDILGRTQGYRIRKELKLILEEPDPMRSIIRLRGLSYEIVLLLMSKAEGAVQKSVIRDLLVKECKNKEKRRT